MDTKPAQEIEVKAFKHIVMCPFLLRGQPKLTKQSVKRDEDSEQNSLLGPWVEEFTRGGGGSQTKPWVEQYGKGVHERFSYNQVVYFHPFVRDFLFGDGNPKPNNRSLRLLTRGDIKSVDVELGKWQPEGNRLRLDVARVELYLCKPAIAILVVEVTNPRRLDAQNNEHPEAAIFLSDLQDFTDQFRRLYPPFWWDEKEKTDDQNEKEGKACQPGLCLRSLTWRGENGTPLELTPDLHPEDLDAAGAKYQLSSLKKNFDSFTRVGAEPPLFAHWQWLFGATIRPAQKHGHVTEVPGEQIDGMYVQQMLDERMPVMTYYAVDDPAEVSEGDRDRLTFVDASGSDAYPYDENFLAERRADHTYSRFDHYKTHYFCSGYGFTMLGGANDLIYRDILSEHFNHHYFCLGLIAHYQRAALLYFADELSNSIKDLKNQEMSIELTSPYFREHAETIQHRFIKFRSRSFFNEVTNQLQGRELFDMWFRVLETQKLFDMVDSTSEQVTSRMVERESRQLARIANGAIPWLIGLQLAACLFAAIVFIDPQNWGQPIAWSFWLVVVLSLFTVWLSDLLLWDGFRWMRLFKSIKALWLQRFKRLFRGNS